MARWHIMIGLGLCLGGANVAAQQAPTLSGIHLPPNDGGVRRWDVTGPQAEMRAKPSPDADVISTLPSGTVMANLGCSTEGDAIWCQLRPLRGGQSGFARASHLRPAVGPDGVVAMGTDDSRDRARRERFDSVSEVRCAQERGEPLGICEVGIARSGGGDATVRATFPNGFARLLFFVHGEFIRASSTMSGVGTDVDWEVVDGVHRIRVDDQRFEIPHALLFQ